MDPAADGARYDPPMSPSSTFYRRPLPDGLVPFASADGRRLFREALAAGGLEGWFALAEQFHTQSDPAFCGLGTLVVALNALEIDPGRIWKGPWRWYAEELLDCCLPLEEVRQKGLTLDELACLARCNGATARPVHADEGTAEALRAAVRTAAASPRGSVVVAAYARQTLGQTGQGHFSPVAGYHPERDLALVLDVARFKYPPHWVPLDRLWEAMKPLDPESGRPRGFLVLEASPMPAALFFRLAAADGARELGAALFGELPGALPGHPAVTAGEVVSALDRGLGDRLGAFASGAPDDSGRRPTEHETVVERLLGELRTTAAFDLARLARLASAPLRAEALAILLLALPDQILAAWPAAAREALAPFREIPQAAATLAAEVGALREQLLTLRTWHERSDRRCAVRCEESAARREDGSNGRLTPPRA
jgi:glutathione gamma-glutamylcysteinyltransferase